MNGLLNEEVQQYADSDDDVRVKQGHLITSFEKVIPEKVIQKKVIQKSHSFILQIILYFL